MLAAAKNLGDGAGGMDDLLVRLRAREKARHGLQVGAQASSSASSYSQRPQVRTRVFGLYGVHHEDVASIHAEGTIGRCLF